MLPPKITYIVPDDPRYFFTLDEAADVNGATYCPVCMKKRLVYTYVEDERDAFAQADAISSGEEPRREWACPDGCAKS
jgi:hypothetical protein